MTESRTFVFNYDLNQVGEVRKKIDECSNFIINGEELAQKRSERKSDLKFCRKESKSPDHDSIYACLDRLDGDIEYINSLELATEDYRNKGNAKDFCDFINTVYRVINDIKTLGCNFNVDEEEYKNNFYVKDCFECPSYLKFKHGSDLRFFEYVRSLVAVHSNDTSRFKEYHGDKKSHRCPYTDWQDYSNVKADLTAVIYTSDGKTELLPLWVKHFERYLQKWIDFMNNIKNAIERYHKDCILKYQSKRIKTPDEFSSYNEYIENLCCEFKERDGNINIYILEYYQNMFTLKLSNSANNIKFKKYKEAVRYSLSFLHERMQNMNLDSNNSGIIYPEEDYETQLFIELWMPDYKHTDKPNFKYTLEKLDCSVYPEALIRTLLNGIKEPINQFVIFSNTEDTFETRVLISMALYFESLAFPNILNKNIPNDLKYRERLYTEEEWEKLVRNK